STDVMELMSSTVEREESGWLCRLVKPSVHRRNFISHHAEGRVQIHQEFVPKVDAGEEVVWVVFYLEPVAKRSEYSYSVMRHDVVPPPPIPERSPAPCFKETVLGKL
ncbi:Hypothetical protein SMAX5B_008037, partial [Scophthalmus maximus]